ncbi:MAG: sigma-54-dependent Fis family transcriptional regulator [Bacteroidaceae bacterium]|nr:sigma-54-dependent Fis family transcriptional regulator [Bacteroidaceae bacterium]
MAYDLTQIKNRYGIIGRDRNLDAVLDTALQVAKTNLAVFIQGESGVGKEVIPRIIHDNSLRKTKRYIAINCGSIPEGTIDSELFGHVKGSFTGAVGDHEGYFGAANGGTLFLDEVGELPLSTQVRLLRVLETGEYIPVGSNEPRKTDVRIVAATNVQIEKAIREGRFREDLYYRLCTISVKMPPLRERGEDAVMLFMKFAMDTAAQYGIPQPLRLTPEAQQVVMSYKWPGNIRQLRNVVEQMNILCSDRTVTPEVLERYEVRPSVETTDLTLHQPSLTAKQGESVDQTLKMMQLMIQSLKMDVEMLKQRVETHPQSQHAIIHQLPAPAYPEASEYPEPSEYSEYADYSDKSDNSDDDEDLNLEKMERRLIEKALRRSRNRRKVAADDLGISERTLYRKIKDYGIEE